MVIDAAPTPEPIRVSIADSLGLMCAEEVTATRSLPGFAQAAVDGYAVRSVDVGGGVPLGSRPPEEGRPPVDASLPVVGEVAAGSQKPLRLQPRQAVRVATGAPLPTLSDAVLPLEWTDRGRKRVTAQRAVRTGDFVRKEGDDIQPGGQRGVQCDPHLVRIARAGQPDLQVLRLAGGTGGRGVGVGDPGVR